MAAPDHQRVDTQYILVQPLVLRKSRFPVSDHTSDVTARRMPRRARPLKMEAAEMARDINDFADEMEPGDRPRFERFRGKLRGVDATQRHLGSTIALGPVRPDAPLLHR